MKWLSVPVDFAGLIETVRQAIKERSLHLQYGTSATDPIRKPPLNGLSFSPHHINTLRAFYEYSIDPRKLNDWQGESDLSKEFNKAYNDKNHQLWKDFDLDHDALYKKIRPYLRYTDYYYFFQVAKMLNNNPFFPRLGEPFCKITQKAASTRKFPDWMEKNEERREMLCSFPTFAAAYYEKDNYAEKLENFQCKFLKKMENKFTGTIKIKTAGYFKKEIFYTNKDPVTEIFNRGEIITSISTDTDNTVEFKIADSKVKSEIEEIFNIDDENISLAKLTYHYEQIPHGDYQDFLLFFLTKDNFIMPDFKYWDINAMPEKIKNKLL